MEKGKRKRILLAKAGLDGHDRGIVLVAMALRDAGIEVIYTGRHQSVEQIVSAAIQEDVDIVGLSSLADAHMVLAPRVVNGLRKNGAANIKVILGGFIQPQDEPFLKEAGIARVFGTSSKLDDIVSYCHAA
ncbi:cobalamin B12-binding domain-containing protein [Georgfuchsia toluolica]|uniref:cobalamin B12-binding domain-containing protein n=1 Tax=Georgfuchsia toluolica TaxID=424218 RepID=UPI001C73AEE8|nr:cobalamin B12-binding domain-containing protein [Georgfuchsia toluolica]